MTEESPTPQKTDGTWRKPFYVLLLVIGAIIFILRWESIVLFFAPGGLGFESYNPPLNCSTCERGKTLWDWLELAIIPLVLAGGAIGFGYLEQKQTETREIQNKAIELDRQREAVLQSYLDKMSDLIIEKNLRPSPNPTDDAPRDNVFIVAQALTINTLRQLDTHRKNILFQFLRSSGLHKFILCVASMTELDLSQTLMFKINLIKTDLYRANLQGANLHHTNLAEANLNWADLSRANLEKAELCKTELVGAKLIKADLPGANLSGVILRYADLSRAVLFGADLTDADLTGATITLEQLAQAASLHGATLPDGSIHD